MGEGVASASPPRDQASPGRIHELHGLRGVALALVVVFHLFGGGRVSGGVDVFLLLSGYLITRSLVGRLERGDRGVLRRHYARTAVRLIPAATVVLIATLGLSAWVLPLSRRLEVGWEVIASALYVQNWELIRHQLSYGAAGPDASPLQHFWSLSVQGQFFIVWPLAIVALALVCRRAGWSLRTATLWLAAAVTVASFAYAVFLVAVDQPLAYFSTWSRLWQLTLGAVAALTLTRLRLPARWLVVVGWGGLVLVVSAGAVLDAAHTFPGVHALWPLLGALAVLAASSGERRSALRTMMEWWPVRTVADRAYELYLWHWPLLVFLLASTGQDAVTAQQAVVIFAVSLLLSHLTHRWVSAPARRAHLPVPTRAAVVSAGAVCALVGATIVGLGRLEASQDDALARLLEASGDHPGALVPVDHLGPWSESPRPSNAVIRSDLPEVYSWGCIQDWRDSPVFVEVLTCQVTTPGEGKPLVVLTGGSHAVQWYTPLKTLAQQYGWELKVIDKDGCRFADAEAFGTGSASCDTWNREAFDAVVATAPDLVFTVGTTTDRPRYSLEMLREDQVSNWSRLGEHDIAVAAIRDNPRFTWNVADCLAASGTRDSCGLPRGQALAFDIDAVVGDLPGNVSFLDLSDVFCSDEFCPAIIGNVVVYRDHDHITNAYAATTAHRLEQELRAYYPWLFEGESGAG